jgi:hypothetical protein
VKASSTAVERDDELEVGPVPVAPGPPLAGHHPAREALRDRDGDAKAAVGDDAGDVSGGLLADARVPRLPGDGLARPDQATGCGSKGWLSRVETGKVDILVDGRGGGTTRSGAPAKALRAALGASARKKTAPRRSSKK